MTKEIVVLSILSAIVGGFIGAYMFSASDIDHKHMSASIKTNEVSIDKLIKMVNHLDKRSIHHH